ncbi:MAG: hypothetical protein LLF28_01080 [Nitrospiraceae bacterium]|nr:hypothetical protein [Nitrospiraceae bacterium]
MIIRFFILLALLFSFAATDAFSQEKDSFQFKKQQEIQQVKPKKSVKIKVKRLQDGRYTWELSGDDADEIANVDRKLRKQLKVE